MVKIILAGTPNFSVPTFEKIIKSFNVVAIITQPDKPIGRQKKIIPCPVKLLAQKYNIKCFSPYKISEIIEELKQLDFDFLITMAYGQIIPQSILDLPKKAAINIHGSLLPKYRGAAPIQYSILDGNTQSGITIMYMVKEMDAGDILIQKSFSIEKEENADDIFNKVSKICEENIELWINEINENKVQTIKQNINEVTFAPKISKDFEELKLDTKENTFNKIRALSSNPGAFWFDKKRNKRIKIFKASFNKNKNAIIIPCLDGELYGTIFQIEGKMKASVE